MSEVALHLGPLTAPGFNVGRSGTRWLRHDGYVCKPGEVLGFCNIGLHPSQPSSIDPFRSDRRDFQLAFTTPLGGRLKLASDVDRGGWMDQLAFKLWDPEDRLCSIEPPGGRAGGDPVDRAGLIMLSGRRMADFIEVRSGPLSGWHDRSRAWSGEGDANGMGTLLGLGICDLTEALWGPSRTFAELIQGAAGGVHIVRMQDEPLVPCATVLTEQLRRTPEQAAEIAEDMVGALAGADTPPSPSDLLFVGALLAGLQRRALTDDYPLLTRTGLGRSGQPDAIVLSLRGEPSRLLRHRRLGYAINVHNYRMGEGGPWLRRWLVKHFEPVQRTLDDIKRDLVSFLGALRPETSVLALNAMAEAPGEDIQTYQGLGESPGEAVASVRAKELNLLLHDLVTAHGVSLVDVDAIASELGGRRHTMDPMHHSGAVQAEIREEMLSILAARNVPGFSRPTM